MLFVLLPWSRFGIRETTSGDNLVLLSGSDQGDFSLLTSLPWSEFLVSTFQLACSSHRQETEESETCWSIYRGSEVSVQSQSML